MPRSGTSLLDKLLSQHQHVAVFSQPLPLLFVETKRAFLQAQCPDATQALATPLGDLVGERQPERDAFQAFLHTYQLAVPELQALVEQLRTYPGCYTQPPPGWTPNQTPASLFQSWATYCDELCTQLASQDVPAVLGAKETFSEEYIPYFLANGSRVIIVLRDPRDAICSAISGQGTLHAGRRRPLLFNVRQWRKSAEFALAYRNHPDVELVRYEQLVTRPIQVLNRVFSFLGVLPWPEDFSLPAIRDIQGKPWRSNSSHNPSSVVSADSIGRYPDHLTSEQINLIQCTCFAEMTCLGYDTGVQRQHLEAQLDAVQLDETELAGVRPELASYVWTRALKEAELRRWRFLLHGECRHPGLFVFDRNIAQLTRAARGVVT